MAERSANHPMLLAYPFRPFFLLTGVYGALIVAAWVAYLFLSLPLPVGVNPGQWHGHEMLFGMVPAAIAGFLLTAMSNWTGAPPLQNHRLLGLLLVWLAGRLAMWLSGYLPAGLVAVLDLAFLPLLAGYAASVLWRYGSRHNLILVVMLVLLSLANLAMHLDFAGLVPGLGRLGEIMALDLVTLIMVVIGGRIIPAFTANWLRLQGRDSRAVRPAPSLDLGALIATALMIPADLITGYPAIGGIVALTAALLNGMRLSRWAGWRTLDEPLLWILHIGYLWIVAALLIKGLVPFVDGLAETVWFHALGTGAIGTLILGVMTRVAMGHTGRPLRLPRYAISIYIGVLVAGIARLLAATGMADYQLGITVSAVAWAAAFILFVLIYWPILSRPRADGRPG